MDFVKAKGGKRKQQKQVTLENRLVGEPCTPETVVWLTAVSAKTGWDAKRFIRVARSAKSYRTPVPRASTSEYPYRSTWVLYSVGSEPTWRCLEQRVNYTDLRNQHAVLPVIADTMITQFYKD